MTSVEVMTASHRACQQIRAMARPEVCRNRGLWEEIGGWGLGLGVEVGRMGYRSSWSSRGFPVLGSSLTGLLRAVDLVRVQVFYV